MALLFFLAKNLVLGFLSLTFQTLFFLNTNLSTFHTGQLVSITVTSLLVKPFNSSPSLTSSFPSSSSSASASAPPPRRSTAESPLAPAGALPLLVAEEGRKILGFVCFLGHFFEVRVRVVPVLKSSARTVVNGGGS